MSKIMFMDEEYAGIHTATSAPTAGIDAAFDSSAHINSEDMTAQEVSDFVDNLDASSGGGAFAKLTASGTNTVTVPSTAIEVVVVARHPTIIAISYTFTLVSDMLSESRHYYSGYGWGSSNNAAEISVNDRTIGIVALYNNGTNYTSSAELIVYYR